RDGDVVLALESSGLHSNGYSLVRKILADASLDYSSHSDDLGGIVGEVLLEPTRLYSGPLVRVLAQPALAGAIHSLSHVTGGGIAANLARVLPRGSWVEVDRSTWSPAPVFRVLSSLAGSSLESAEGTWNLGIGFFAVVAASKAADVTAAIEAEGIRTWTVGTVSTTARAIEASDGFEQGAKGVDGGAVRLVGTYAP
ncbi:MAG: AIR synthase-related protein, partial [Herbiconiux sp.]|nr:AIR synthase-related protein [Herbiconiux sp.]